MKKKVLRYTVTLDGKKVRVHGKNYKTESGNGMYIAHIALAQTIRRNILQFFDGDEEVAPTVLSVLAMILTGHMDGQGMIDDLSQWSKEHNSSHDEEAEEDAEE